MGLGRKFLFNLFIIKILVSCCTGNQLRTYHRCRDPTVTDNFVINECPAGQVINVNRAVVGVSSSYTTQPSLSCPLDSGSEFSSDESQQCQKSTSVPWTSCNGTTSCSFSRTILDVAPCPTNKSDNANYVRIFFYCVTGPVSVTTASTQSTVVFNFTSPSSDNIISSVSTSTTTSCTNCSVSSSSVSPSSLSTGAIVGIAVGVGAFLLIVIVIIVVVCVVFSRRSRSSAGKSRGNAKQQNPKYSGGEYEMAADVVKSTRPGHVTNNMDDSGTYSEAAVVDPTYNDVMPTADEHRANGAKTMSALADKKRSARTAAASVDTNSALYDEGYETPDPTYSGVADSMNTMTVVDNAMYANSTVDNSTDGNTSPQIIGSMADFTLIDNSLYDRAGGSH